MSAIYQLKAAPQVRTAVELQVSSAETQLIVQLRHLVPTRFTARYEKGAKSKEVTNKTITKEIQQVKKNV